VSRLVTIPFSHFCEKARWALEYAGVPFVEDGHVPLLHYRATLSAGGGRTVPVFVDGSTVLADSSDILRYADRLLPEERKLFPSHTHDEVTALEDRFDRKLGPHTRRVAYFHGLADKERTLRLATARVPRWEATLLRAARPVAVAMMRRGMRINAVSVVRSLAILDQLWDDVDALLKDGRHYLASDRFTAADLTFASLAAPLVFPPEQPWSMPLDDTPPALRELALRYRARPAGQLALRAYRDHRVAR
jgi:glutathione S-transferase